MLRIQQKKDSDTLNTPAFCLDGIDLTQVSVERDPEVIQYFIGLLKDARYMEDKDWNVVVEELGTLLNEVEKEYGDEFFG